MCPQKKKEKLFLRAVQRLPYRRDSAAGNLLVQIGALGGVRKSLRTRRLGLIGNALGYIVVPIREQLVLPAEHFLLLRRSGVVITQKVQATMDGKQRQLVA